MKTVVCSVCACAACFGQSDSPLAAGMNWGIFSLLGTILVVLGGVAAFFVFLAKRAAAATPPAAGAAEALPPLAGRGGHSLASRLLRQVRTVPAPARRRRSCAQTGRDMRSRGALDVRRP
jgi:hypothetical protein